VTKKKHILISEDYSEFQVLGIASTETEFQLSIMLNLQLGLKLTLATPIIKKNKSQTESFACFKYDNEDTLQIILIKNKQKGSLLFQKQHLFDYFVLLSGSEAQKTADILKRSIKNQPNISLVAPIDAKNLSKLKSYIN
jgi:hypothetical protein